MTADRALSSGSQFILNKPGAKHTWISLHQNSISPFFFCTFLKLGDLDALVSAMNKNETNDTFDRVRMTHCLSVCSSSGSLGLPTVTLPLIS